MMLKKFDYNRAVQALNADTSRVEEICLNFHDRISCFLVSIIQLYITFFFAGEDVYTKKSRRIEGRR